MASDQNKSSMIRHEIDPTIYDISINALLISVGAEKYTEIFSKNNIGQSTLMELTEDDMVKFGLDDSVIRKKLLEEIKNLPTYKTLEHYIPIGNSTLEPIDIADILTESSEHLHKIYLSMLANSLALKKTIIPDTLLYRDKYASDITVSTLSEITNLLNSIDVCLHTHLKKLPDESQRKRKNKKIIVGTVGGATIVILTILFVQSLKLLKK